MSWQGRRGLLNERIGELLGKENLLSAEQLTKAREQASAKGQRLGAQITSLGFLDEEELTDFVAKQYGVPSINLDDFDIDPEVVRLIPQDSKLRARYTSSITPRAPRLPWARSTSIT